jgi:hypothetical protein
MERPVTYRIMNLSVCSRLVGQARACWLLVALLQGLLLTAGRSPAEPLICFDADAPGQICIAPEFRLFWEQHGGLAVFGEPVAEAGIEATPSGSLRVQYFEQARLEAHPENAAPYNILIGRMGAERLQELGPLSGSQAGDATDCEVFVATNQAVCGPFLRYWRAHGLNLGDPGVSERESLGLLGLPLADARIEAGALGESLRVQWFERARLVLQDGQVIRTPLGRERARGVSTAPPSEVANRPATEQSPSPVTTDPAPPSEPAMTDPAPPSATTPSPVRDAAEQTPPVAGPPDAPPMVPRPGPPCDRHVPLPEEGLQLWVIAPEGGEDQAVACVRLIVDGRAASGANAKVLRAYGGELRPSPSQTTSGTGVAGFVFYVGAGSPGMPDNVQAVVEYRGTIYRATTWVKKALAP